MALVRELVAVARERLVIVNDDALVTEAARYLDGRHINLVIVCDKAGTMIGVVSRTDIVRMIGLCQGCGCTVCVAKVMTKSVICCHPNDLLKNVWLTMKERNLLHVPIVDENLKPLGVINARDALLVLMEHAEFENSMLRDYVMNIGYK